MPSTWHAQVHCNSKAISVDSILFLVYMYMYNSAGACRGIYNTISTIMIPFELQVLRINKVSR